MKPTFSIPTVPTPNCLVVSSIGAIDPYSRHFIEPHHVAASSYSTSTAATFATPFQSEVGSATALADIRTRVLATCDSPDQTDEHSARATRPRHHLGSHLNRTFAQTLPALGFVALAVYGTNGGSIPTGELSKPDLITAWLDQSSIRTWDNPTPETTEVLGNAARASILPVRSDAPNLVAADNGGLLEEQPRYDYREAIRYAQTMGLPTDFPL